MRSPYAVLGVKKSAEANTIKSAYRVLAKTWHPDQNRHDPEASRRFAEITQAYRLLIDPELRSEFDGGRIGADGRRSSATSRGFGANPFAVFREAWRTRPQARTGEPDQKAGTGGEDISDFDAMVSHIFGDAAAGGKASRPGSKATGARYREGRSKAGAAQSAPEGGNAQDDPLAVLDELFARWKTIHGNAQNEPFAIEHVVEIDLSAVITGVQAPARLADGREFTVDIPAGVQDGEVLRASVPGGAGPEVFVTVRYAPHSRFRVVERDLHMDAAVELRQAVLGGSMTVEGLDGPIRIEVPEWMTGDAPVLVEGRGLPSPDGARGDLHVHLHIRLPEQRDARLTELMRDERKSWYV